LREALSISFTALGGGREKEAVKIMKQHVAIVLDVVKKLEELTKAFQKWDVKKLEALEAELDQLETKADGVRRKFEASLVEGAFLPAYRSDFSALAERIDDVADMAQEAARAFVWRGVFCDIIAKACKKKPGAREIAEGFVKIAQKAVDATTALKEAVGALMSNVEVARANANKVELAEHESDLLEEKLIKQLYTHERLFDPVSIMQIKDIVEKMGAVSNRAEDASDLISIISYVIMM
jgi:predicted phosphate transport protein (TIGR00153 family)